VKRTRMRKSPTRSSSPSSTAWCLKPNSARRLAASVAPVADASSLAPERKSAWRWVSRTRTISAPSDFAASMYRSASRSGSITAAAFSGSETTRYDEFPNPSSTKGFTYPGRMASPAGCGPGMEFADRFPHDGLARPDRVDRHRSDHPEGFRVALHVGGIIGFDEEEHAMLPQDNVALDDRYTGPSRMFGSEDKVRHHLDSLLALRGARLRGVLALDQEGRRPLRQSCVGTTDHGLDAVFTNRIHRVQFSGTEMASKTRSGGALTSNSLTIFVIVSLTPHRGQWVYSDTAKALCARFVHRPVSTGRLRLTAIKTEHFHLRGKGERTRSRANRYVRSHLTPFGAEARAEARDHPDD